MTCSVLDGLWQTSFLSLIYPLTPSVGQPRGLFAGTSTLSKIQENEEIEVVHGSLYRIDTTDSSFLLLPGTGPSDKISF